MNIATLLFAFESELGNYLDADCGTDDVIRVELESLFGHVHAVRSVVDVRDDWPDSKPRRVSIAIQSDADEWEEN